MPATVFAAEVLEMRLGQHAAYTRVVFELSAPAGYSLEQNLLKSGDTELVVTLDASASNQEKLLKESWVRGVSLSGQGAKSVARIRLGDDGLQVKEMILGSPPRIVLDVLAPAATKTADTAVAPTPATNTPSRPVAPISHTRTETPQPVASINHGVPPSPKRVATKPAAKPAARPAASPPKAMPTAPSPKPTPAPRAASTTTPPKVAKTPPPPARKKPSLPAAPAAVPQPSSDSLFTSRNIGGGLALLGLVGGGAFFMLRRRGEGDELVDPETAEEDLLVDNPFASLGDDFAVADESGQGDATGEIPMAEHVDEVEANDVDEFAADDDPDADIPIAKVSADSGPQEDLFETSVTESLGAAEAIAVGTIETDETETLGAESTEAEGENMEPYGDAGIDAGMDAMPPIPGAGAADSSEVMHMLREFEQRVSGLESRLEEVTEAKERLERQVAAQTEELRVQRAAIARTQRALRNLSRPDDESPTEPALRNPNA